MSPRAPSPTRSYNVATNATYSTTAEDFSLYSAATMSSFFPPPAYDHVWNYNSCMARGCPRCCCCTYENFPLKCVECEEGGRDELRGGRRLEEPPLCVDLTSDYSLFTTQEVAEAVVESADEVVVRSPSKREVRESEEIALRLGEDILLELSAEEREVIVGDVPEEVQGLTDSEMLGLQPKPEFYIDFGRKKSYKRLWDAIQGLTESSILCTF